MTAKIVVPVDFSPVTDSVIAWATSIARERKAALIFLHVQEPIGENLGGELYFPVPIHENPELRRALLALKPADESVPYLHEIQLGSVPDLILQTAAQEGVELIVMGSHGRRGLGRLLMGSVAECVMRRAECPVLIVKQPAAAHATHPAAGAVSTGEAARG